MCDPSIGRFLSEDLLGFEAGDENLFRYVKNRPTVFSDPSGLQQFQQPLAPQDWYNAARQEYLGSVDNVDNVINQIAQLIDNPARYYNNGGAIPPPGIAAFSLNLANNLTRMQTTANSLHNAGLAVFAENLDNGAAVMVLQENASTVMNNLDRIIQTNNRIYGRIEQQLRAVNNLSNAIGQLNALDRGLLAFGNPLRSSMQSVGAFRDTWANTIRPSTFWALALALFNISGPQLCLVES